MGRCSRNMRFIIIIINAIICFYMHKVYPWQVPQMT